MIYDLLYILIFNIITTVTIIKISKKFRLLDFPDKRKVHAFPVPFTGGIILSITYLFIIYKTTFDVTYLNIILSYGLLISISGFLDDKYNFNPGTKIVLQILPIFFVIEQGLFLEDIGKYYFFGKLSLGSFAKIFTLLCCLFLINAFNYNDGLDSLMSLITIYILLYFAYLVFDHGYTEVSLFLSFISIPLFVFTIFNIGFFKNYKIFLGDSGSNLLGFICALVAISLYKFNNIHPSIIIWPLSYLTFEFISVNFIRLLHGKYIFKPGRDHLHYELKKFNLSNRLIVSLILLLNFLLGGLGLIIFKFFNENISLYIYILCFIIYQIFRYKLHSRAYHIDNLSKS